MHQSEGIKAYRQEQSASVRAPEPVVLAEPDGLPYSSTAHLEQPRLISTAQPSNVSTAGKGIPATVPLSQVPLAIQQLLTSETGQFSQHTAAVTHQIRSDTADSAHAEQLCQPPSAAPQDRTIHAESLQGSVASQSPEGKGSAAAELLSNSGPGDVLASQTETTDAGEQSCILVCQALAFKLMMREQQLPCD